MNKINIEADDPKGKPAIYGDFYSAAAALMAIEIEREEDERILKMFEEKLGRLNDNK